MSRVGKPARGGAEFISLAMNNGVNEVTFSYDDSEQNARQKGCKYLDPWFRELDFQRRMCVADAARQGLRDAIGAGFALRGTSKAPASDVQRW